jgi:negative regulator of flagellin synthesis FlgM
MKILNENPKLNITSYFNRIGNKYTIGQKPENKSMVTSNDEKVALSNQIKELNEASTAIKMVPDIREEKITMIKEQISNGTYQIDHKKIAEKIILDILETRSIK